MKNIGVILFLLGLGFISQLQAESIVQKNIEYKKYIKTSKIGLDYLDISKGNMQLANILGDGEEEFFKNINEKNVQTEFKKQDFTDPSEYNELWQEISETIGEGQMDQRQLDILNNSNPKMLLDFYNLNKKEFPLLQKIGELNEKKEELNEKKEELKKEKEELNEKKEELKKEKEETRRKTLELKKEKEETRKEKEETRKLRQYFGK